ncbi:elongation factor Tu (EF-Tu) [Legionella nautarum]|uniref:Adenylyl-sulfate kinase n=1 Tax=Legionella nautarum TaxID=45070 RepID=A0A0W0WUU8_9GAMM|nr:sulfate adenylyltransferase subunit CysN [Legionella nautarum]KTD36113.1 elongation factor Tu (EF-Tu) [Legionella nautarum]
MQVNSLVTTDFTSYLNQHDQKDLLRFITCGSVDDGKSTLIGRLLYESQLIYDDQLDSLITDSKKFGTIQDGLDLALLMDGLSAEREQGITIDVAYRFFSTDKRKFIVADTPGHEQYTRNMATGASTAQAAVLIVDARKGIVTQTRRHSFILNTFGVKNIILAINKMDLVHYEQSIYEKIKEDYLEFAHSLDFTQIIAIPISALKGDNIIQPSVPMHWHKGLTLLQHLEQITIQQPNQEQAFRMPVQWVNRRSHDFRGFAGLITSGSIKPGDTIKVIPGNKQATINRIVSYDGDLPMAEVGQSITLTLNEEIDISRGVVLCDADKPCATADQFMVTLLWMHESPMIASRQYLFKGHTVTSLCSLGKPQYRIDINNGEHLAAQDFQLNELGSCELFLDKAIAFDTYKASPRLGSFILIDKLTYETVAAGLIHSELRQLTHLSEQNVLIKPSHRAAIKGQKPLVLWFTGLSGAGKSTIANLLEYELNSRRKHTILLDGDLIRHGLNRDLDFSVSGRAENIRRIIELAKIMTEAGLISLVSFISPFKAEREMAREQIGREQFLEIYVDVPLNIAETRDVKGLYKKARAGEISNFTGISSPYEAPENPDLHLDTSVLSPGQAVHAIIDLLGF